MEKIEVRVTALTMAQKMDITGTPIGVLRLAEVLEKYIHTGNVPADIKVTK